MKYFALTLCMFSVLPSINLSIVHAEKPLAHPERIKLPEEYLHCEVMTHWKTGNKHLIFPRSIYTTSHYDGWQLCLKRYFTTELSAQDLRIRRINLELPEKYCRTGLIDGFNNCRKKLMQFEKTKIDIKELREKAGKAIRIRKPEQEYFVDYYEGQKK